jgi:hypothetical protein
VSSANLIRPGKGDSWRRRSYAPRVRPRLVVEDAGESAALPDEPPAVAELEICAQVLGEHVLQRFLVVRVVRDEQTLRVWVRPRRRDRRSNQELFDRVQAAALRRDVVRALLGTCASREEPALLGELQALHGEIQAIRFELRMRSPG